jgi:LysM repeat protein
VKSLRNIALGLLAVIVAVVIGVSLWVGDQYRRLIYPGVAVTAPFADPVDVGGLTRAAARNRLYRQLPDPEKQGITLRVGDQAWRLTWAMVGQSYDVNAAVDAAYRVDRDRPWWLAILAVLRPEPQTVATPLSPADPATTRTFIETVAEEIATAPQDAEIAIEGGQVVVTPAVTGQSLDPEIATVQVLNALSQGASDLVLQTDPRLPQIETAEPAYSEANVLLSAPFVLTVHDPLTGDLENGGYRAVFTAESPQVSPWLSFVVRDNRYALNISPTQIRGWVETIAPQVSNAADIGVEAEAGATTSVADDEGVEEGFRQVRFIDIDATTARIAAALRTTASGSTEGPPHTTAAVIGHPPQTYTVQPGDVFYDIAFTHGFPQYQLELANPKVEPGLIDVGQQLTIPSIDVLFPHPIVPGKRIEVDLPTQTLVAYEEDDLIFEFRISSGISKTPTLAGQFQILFKEKAAFARRWRLDMPYFMGFYEEGEDFYNGFHELPITAYGTRLSAGVLGYPASFGCIILDIGEAEALYNWAEVGTLVRVHGVAPGTPFGQPTLDDIAPLTGTETP